MKPFVHQVRVRYAETDQLGIAYYAHYLVWFEVARVEFLRHSGISYADVEREGFKLPVAECQIKYFAPARYDDLLNVETKVKKTGKTFVTFAYNVVHEATKKKLAEGETKLVCVDRNLKLVRMPKILQDCLEL